MWRLALLLWIMGGTVLAGVLVTVFLLTPTLAPTQLIPIDAAVGAIIAIPPAFMAAKAIAARTSEA